MSVNEQKERKGTEKYERSCFRDDPGQYKTDSVLIFNISGHGMAGA